MKSHEYKGGGAILDKPTGGRQGKVSVCVRTCLKHIIFMYRNIHIKLCTITYANKIILKQMEGCD
jgi:hypothetical protein